MIRYRCLHEDEICRELFKDFIRHQRVTKCWRKEEEAWVIRDVPFIDDWSEEDYQFLPSKNDHFVSGKIIRTFSTSKPGVYTFTFNALTYGGYEMKPVTVTITAVDANTATGEEAMK